MIRLFRIVAAVALLALAPPCGAMVENDVGSVPLASVEESSAHAEGPVEIDGEMQPPVLKKRVEPKYPYWAALTGKQGIVRLRAVVGTDGMVRAVEVVECDGPKTFAYAAVRAVEHWEYEPARLHGRPVPVYYHVVVKFTLRRPRKPPRPPESADDPVPAGILGIKAPVARTRAAPEYPPAAFAEGRAGWVVLEIHIRTDGTVADATVVRSEGGAEFEDAAVKAVRSWTFEPARFDRRPQAVYYRVKLRFTPEAVDPVRESMEAPPPASASDDR